MARMDRVIQRTEALNSVFEVSGTRSATNASLCVIVNIMYSTAKLGYVEEVYFVNMLQGN